MPLVRKNVVVSVRVCVLGCWLADWLGSAVYGDYESRWTAMRTGEGSLTLGSSAFVCDRVCICGGCVRLYKVPSSALYMHFNQMGFKLFLNPGSCLSLKLFFLFKSKNSLHHYFSNEGGTCFM